MEALTRENGWVWRSQIVHGERRSFYERTVEPGVVERRYDDATATTRITGHPVEVAHAGSSRHSRGSVARSGAVPASALITFSPEARSAIVAATSWGTGQDAAAAARETGGSLLGRVTRSGVEVVAARVSATNRTPHSVDVGLGPGFQLDLVVVGDWHSHGGPDGTPSPVDRAGWDNAYRSARPKTGAPFWVAVIAAVERYKKPILRAWLVDLDGLTPVSIGKEA